MAELWFETDLGNEFDKFVGIKILTVTIILPLALLTQDLLLWVSAPRQELWSEASW